MKNSETKTYHQSNKQYQRIIKKRQMKLRTQNKEIRNKRNALEVNY